MAHHLERKHMTDAHYTAFGRIVQAFVSVETMYAHLAERILGIETHASALVFAAYGYDALKNLLQAVISESNQPDDEKKVALKLIEKVQDKSRLRNNVAHNSWKPGRRPGSIKPMVLRTKGAFLILGIEHNEKDWTAKELSAEADEILERGFLVGQFFAERGVKIGANDGRD